jgi:lipopolysaccharide export system permease protein
MLFHSSIRQELSRSFGAILIVLVTVVMTMTLIRTLGLASRGSFNPSDVMLVMGYTVLAYMPTLLTLSLFISIIASLSRMYRDSEMVIWLSSGRGLTSVLPALFRFAWPVLAVIAALALLVLPWTNQRIEEMRSQYEKRGDFERIEPGQFQESANGARVFFVEKDNSGDKVGANVFIATTEFGKETMTSARSGRIDNLPNGQFLLLSNGQRLERNLNGSDIKISEFVEYGTQISVEALNAVNSVPSNTRPTIELLENLSPWNLAELSWRFGLILASFNFILIGLAVSGVNPRVGRSGNQIFALFTFVVYYNLLNLGQNWIVAGKFTLFQFMLTLHLSVFFMALLWLAKSHNNWRWRDIVRWRAFNTSAQSRAT